MDEYNRTGSTQFVSGFRHIQDTTKISKNIVHLLHQEGERKPSQEVVSVLTDLTMSFMCDLITQASLYSEINNQTSGIMQIQSHTSTFITPEILKSVVHTHPAMQKKIDNAKCVQQDLRSIRRGVSAPNYYE